MILRQPVHCRYGAVQESLDNKSWRRAKIRLAKGFARPLDGIILTTIKRFGVNIPMFNAQIEVG